VEKGSFGGVEKRGEKSGGGSFEVGAVLSCPVSMQHNLSLRSGKSVDGRPGGSGDGHREVRLVCRGPERRPKDARVRVGRSGVGVVRCGREPWRRTHTARADRKSRPGRGLIGK